MKRWTCSTSRVRRRTWTSWLQLPRADRTTPEDLLALRVRSGANPSAPLVPLRELVKVEQTTVDKSIYHKNLMPVTYVIGDVAGVVESPVYAIHEDEQGAPRARYRRSSAATARR